MSPTQVYQSHTAEPCHTYAILPFKSAQNIGAQVWHRNSISNLCQKDATQEFVGFNTSIICSGRHETDQTSFRCAFVGISINQQFIYVGISSKHPLCLNVLPLFQINLVLFYFILFCPAVGFDTSSLAKKFDFTNCASCDVFLILHFLRFKEIRFFLNVLICEYCTHVRTHVRTW